MFRKKRDNCRDIFRDFAGEFVPEIDGFIKEFFEKKILNAESEFMKEILCYVGDYCLRDGKRIRPLLLLNSYYGYRKGFKKRTEIIKLGAVVELMHSLLLIQDDIIDKSDLRRGEKSLHILLGEKYSHLTSNTLIGQDIASVTADILFSCCIEIISGTDIRHDVKDRFLEIFAKTYERTAWGQILDSLNSMLKSIDPESDAPMQISLMKTAYYTMVYPLIMGYVLSGEKSKTEMESIEAFAVPLGIAFQVRDDLLGVFGIEKDTGKPNDSDIMEGKLTLLVQNTILKLEESDRVRFTDIFLSQDKSKNDIEFVRECISKSGAVEDTVQRHRELIDESYTLLDELVIAKYNKDIMRGVIESVEDIPI
jgi:geranylgeranyl diphosphate synthase type I